MAAAVNLSPPLGDQLRILVVNLTQCDIDEFPTSSTRYSEDASRAVRLLGEEILVKRTGIAGFLIRNVTTSRESTEEDSEPSKDTLERISDILYSKF